MPPEFDYDDSDDDDDDDGEPVWEEVGFIEEATKRLIVKHETEYRKLVKEIDIERLHREISNLKMRVSQRDSEIKKLLLLNPGKVNVPMLTGMANGYIAEIERLESEAGKKRRKKRPRLTVEGKK